MLVRETVSKKAAEFRISDIERECPGVGREWIRRILGEMQTAKEVACEGRGPGPAGGYCGIRVLPLSKGSNKGIDGLMVRSGD